MDEAAALVEQARRNAAWWRHEILLGRVTATPDVTGLLRDLDTAGGIARPEEGVMDKKEERMEAGSTPVVERLRFAVDVLRKAVEWAGAYAHHINQPGDPPHTGGKWGLCPAPTCQYVIATLNAAERDLQEWPPRGSTSPEAVRQDAAKFHAPATTTNLPVHPDAPAALAALVEPVRALAAAAELSEWRYQEGADRYTHIVRTGDRRFICQLAQDTSGVAEARARLIAALVNLVPALLQALAPADGGERP